MSCPCVSTAAGWVVQCERSSLRARAEAAEQALKALSEDGEARDAYLLAAIKTGDVTSKSVLRAAERALAAMTAERDELKRDIADEEQWTAAMRAEQDALTKGSNAWMRHILGTEYGRYWGPTLEAFGRGVDELRQALAESLAREEALREALGALVVELEDDNEDDYARDFAAAQALLALPRDSAALDALLMRCADAAWGGGVASVNWMALPHERDAMRKQDLAAILRGLRP